MSRARQLEASREQASQWLVRLQADSVTEDTKAAFFSWLGEEESNQQAYIEAEKLWGNLGIAEQLPLESSRSSSWLGRLQRPFGAFAGLLLVSLGILFYTQLTGPGQQDYATAIGESAEFLLDDGTRLHLNTDTEVQVTMDSDQRLLKLSRGEAYFDVAHDPQRPLVVVAAGGLVRVLGTRFNIRDVGDSSTVTVIEGVVAVLPESEMDRILDPLLESDITLKISQQARLEADKVISEPVTVDTGETVAWREGRLVYDGERLELVIKDIDRYFPGSIQLGDPTLADLEVVGMLNLRNRSATLAALEATFNVRAVKVSDELTLIQRQPE